MRFEDKTVVVTGGARGIGRACVEAFLNEGARVMINYHSSETAAKELAESYPDRTAICQANISDESEVAALFETTARELGPPSILVNNAGIINREKFPDISADTFRHVLEVNTLGPYLAAREFARCAGENGESIVNIGSMRAFLPTVPDYSSSKAAVHNLTISLAKALAPRIRVNAVAPGFTATDMHKGNQQRLDAEAEKSLLKRYSSAADIADAVTFMASTAARSITGQVLLVDNGRSLG